MRIPRRKNITNEAVEDTKLVPPEVDLEPVVDHTTANTLASKEANEKKAEENIKESGINKIADEVVKDIQDPKKDTPAPKTPSLKPYTEAKKVVDRKALGELISECKAAGRKYRVKRSLEEGFRYIFEEFEDAYPECYFVCHTEDENNETGYFDTLEDAKAYAEAHPEICCIFKVCDDEEEKVWDKRELSDFDNVEKPLDECDKKDVTEDVDEENPVVVEDEVPETFDGKMDFLAKDEQEAIDAYNKVLTLLGDDEANVKEQLNKILDEEIAHRDFLEKVKEDHNLVYEHEHKEEPELVAQEADIDIVEESKDKEVCPNCGKEICECDKKLEEAIIEPEIEPDFEPEAVPAVDVAGEIEITNDKPELDPEAEIEIDSIDTFEPTDEIGKKTMTTIKDAGDGAMFAFKDTLKDLYNLKIKVSDLQQLLSTSSDWLLDLLGFNAQPVEDHEMVGGAFDDISPVTDLSTADINDFDDVEPVDYDEEEDTNFFVED